MVVPPPGAVEQRIPRDQAHPAPGSLAELEDVYAWLEHEADVRTLVRRGTPPQRADHVLEVARRVIYREICRRAPIEVVARSYPPMNHEACRRAIDDGYGAAPAGAFAPEPYR